MNQTLRQVAVIARRDFLAVVATPTFLLFLLAPFFMLGSVSRAGLAVPISPNHRPINGRWW